MSKMDGWKASLTQWTWVWVNFRRWWWTGRPGVLLSRGLQRIVHNWVTELNWTDRMKYCIFRNCCINFSWKGISLWLIIILCESWGFCIFIGIICHWPCHNRMWWYFIARDIEYLLGPLFYTEGHIKYWIILSGFLSV